MGYTTTFEGEFRLDKPLSEAHAKYLRQFARMRRMKRDAAIAETMPDAPRIAVGLPIGVYGSYFVSGVGFAGQDKDDSVLEMNDPPPGQPGLWCQWTPNEAGTAIIWDGGEKFYYYVEWLQYICDHFLKPWGYTLNGFAMWDGEWDDDNGVVVCRNNVAFRYEFPKTDAARKKCKYYVYTTIQEVAKYQDLFNKAMYEGDDAADSVLQDYLLEDGVLIGRKRKAGRRG